ncbi:phage scaffolding protein [Anaeromassilibacillus senegalensis]|uniref:Phage scaffolding protein n=1 Tax=Anaeromassilibacillus senegalensis TaxID=1673717 RepID=A0ABS9CLB2_9FIRM|nr:phage scaffolding protein [Anaeromassilibacillus senegalensis]MCF2651839.1 phage scaffolding protein [Anaeromassilibacillus senegalensis]
MLEWLKTILGETYTEDIDKKISAEIGKAFVSKTDFNTKNEELKTAKGQLKEANDTIAGFKAMDIDGIKRAADDWKAKAEKAQLDADAKIAAIQFDARLDSAILSRHGRSTKAIKAMMDVDTLRKSQNQDSDISAALDTLAKDSAYLFDAPAGGGQSAENSAQGGIRLNSAAPHGNGGTPDYNSMSDAEYYAAVLKKDK